MMKNSDVKETRNYDQFTIGDFNRGIKPGNLKKLDKSVQRVGWLKHPIMVNENMEIIDGQHRFVYAKEHNLPVYYIVIGGLGKEDCVTMNNIRMAWNLADYINFYAKQGIDNYVILKNIIEKYTFASPTTLIGIVKTTGAGGSLLGAVKNGTFSVSTREYNKAIEKLEFLKGIVQYVLSTSSRPSAIINAIAFAYDCPGVNKARLARQIKNYISMTTPAANLDMALKEVEKLYNYRNPRGEYVYIYTEYKKRALDRISHGMKGEE